MKKIYLVLAFALLLSLSMMASTPSAAALQFGSFQGCIHEADEWCWQMIGYGFATNSCYSNVWNYCVANVPI